MKKWGRRGETSPIYIWQNVEGNHQGSPPWQVSVGCQIAPTALATCPFVVLVHCSKTKTLMLLELDKGPSADAPPTRLSAEMCGASLTSLIYRVSVVVICFRVTIERAFSNGGPRRRHGFGLSRWKVRSETSDDVTMIGKPLVHGGVERNPPVDGGS